MQAVGANIEPRRVAKAILIRAYGEFWSPEQVDWKRSWQLLGTSPQGQSINAYEQRGIYVLYDDYLPVYVGKADKQSIGYRLQLHRESQRKGPRWNRFSWFGLRRFNRNGEMADLKSNIHVTSAELISTLEALLILIADPRLNSRREKLKGAVRMNQSDSGRPLTSSEQEIAAIQEKLDTLIKLSS